MAKKHPCEDKLAAHLGDKAKPHEIKAIVREMDNIRSRLFRQGEDVTSPEFQRRAMEFIQNMRHEAAVARRQSAQMLLTYHKLDGFIHQEAFVDNPAEAIKALLAGSTSRLSQGGNLGVARAASGLQADFLTQLHFGLKEAGLDRVMAKGLMDLDVMREMFEMRKGGKPGITGNPHAQAAAKIIKAVNSNIVKGLQAAGSSIRELDGYIMKQIHERSKIVAAGFDKWAEDIYAKLDLDKTFGVMAEGEHKNFLKEVYNQIATGNWDRLDLDSGDDIFKIIGQSPNIAKRTGRSRTLHFKDAESMYEYNKAYGSKNLIESTMSAIHQQSRNIALMRYLGPNPQAMFKTIKRLATKKAEASGNEKAVATLKKQDQLLDNYFDGARGFSNIPGTSLFARSGQWARGLSTAIKLGSAIFRSAPDWAHAAATLQSQMGGSFAGHMGRLFRDYAASFASPAEAKKWAKRLAVAVDDIQAEMFSRYGMEGSADGTLSKVIRLSQKVNLMEFHVQAAKVAMSKQVSMHLADHAGMGWAELPERFRAGLERYGISEEEWIIMRHKGVETFDGVNMMTPEAIRAVPAETFLRGEEGKLDAQVKLLSLLSEQADIASSTVGLRQRAWMGRDEGLGVLARLLGQFKTVGLMMIDNMERIALSDPGRDAKGWQDILRGKGDTHALIRTMTVSTALGGLGIYAQQFATKGAVPDDPSDPKFLAEAFIKSGAGGLYADFLLAEYDRHKGMTFLRSAAGPVLGEVDTAWEIGSKLLHGEAKSARKDALRMAIRNIPNLFYTKYAFDMLMFNDMREWASPGFKRRSEKAAKERGQRFVLPSPTEGM